MQWIFKLIKFISNFFLWLWMKIHNAIVDTFLGSIFIYFVKFVVFILMFIIDIFLLWPGRIAYFFSKKVIPKLLPLCRKIYRIVNYVLHVTYWFVVFLCLGFYFSSLCLKLLYLSAVSLKLHEVIPEGEKFLNKMFLDWWLLVDFVNFISICVGVIFGFFAMRYIFSESSKYAPGPVSGTSYLYQKDSWREFYRHTFRQARSALWAFRYYFIMRRANSGSYTDKVRIALSDRTLNKQIVARDYSFYLHDPFTCSHPRMMFYVPSAHGSGFYESFFSFVRDYNAMYGETVFFDFELQPNELYGFSLMKHRHVAYSDDPNGTALCFEVYYKRQKEIMRKEMLVNHIGLEYPLRFGVVFVSGTLEDATRFSLAFRKWLSSGWGARYRTGHFMHYKFFIVNASELNELEKHGSRRVYYINNLGDIIYDYDVKKKYYFEFLKNAWSYLSADITPILLNIKKSDYKLRVLAIFLLCDQNRHCLPMITTLQKCIATYNDAFEEELVFLLNYSVFNSINTAELVKFGKTADLNLSVSDLELLKKKFNKDPEKHARVAFVKKWKDMAAKLEAIKFYTRQITREFLVEVSVLPYTEGLDFYPVVVVGHHNPYMFFRLRRFIQDISVLMAEQYGSQLFHSRILYESDFDQVFKDFGPDLDESRFGIPLNIDGIPNGPDLGNYVIPVDSSDSKYPTYEEESNDSNKNQTFA